MSKLTLHVPDELVVAAKREAARRRTSVSKLVGDYFRVLKGGSAELQAHSLPSATASLVGCLKGSKVGRQAYVDYLEKKHA